ncbi:succinylglutamate desuccinylase/aspartoacylase family protein [Maribacter sp. HTCC2170]|uniref:succinylglutamate desuccinylase/aspartoacylase family protein n=1 Tax=Maribacter sp. (strain HTCC2170 / KCCM 42371) TaxID=313603 RepID=UPI00006BD50B|nr:succinylglutamate desuccinylase/aspartoacylase family protein [Maribacter sp. HTCC2170]EAR02890.1 Succinylglutamate desuccinylase/aspartoacylase [Maribacter sp. HTCC2170]
MNLCKLLFFAFCSSGLLFGQTANEVLTIQEIDLDNIKSGSIQKFWLQLGSDSQNKPISIPVLVAKGNETGPVLGLTAAIHGNELNGIAIIQNTFRGLDVSMLKGTLIGVPGINPISISNHKRKYIDDEDLNRNFPGKKEGNRSQQMAYQINEKVLPHFDFHIDMHTASFGRINALYGRGDMANDTLAAMLKLQLPDIIVSNKGKPSFGTSSGLTMRAAALAQGIKSITVEYGDPQVYQPVMIERGERGIDNLLKWLKMKPQNVEVPEIENVCSKSYWLFADQGGLLEIGVSLNEKVSKGQRIAMVKNSFGEVLKEFYAPEEGIVIGKSTNPVNMSGGRIIHLGILKSPSK